MTSVADCKPENTFQKCCSDKPNPKFQKIIASLPRNSCLTDNEMNSVLEAHGFGPFEGLWDSPDDDPSTMLEYGECPAKVHTLVDLPSVGPTPKESEIDGLLVDGFHSQRQEKTRKEYKQRLAQEKQSFQHLFARHEEHLLFYTFFPDRRMIMARKYEKVDYQHGPLDEQTCDEMGRYFLMKTCHEHPLLKASELFRILYNIRKCGLDGHWFSKILFFFN